MERIFELVMGYDALEHLSREHAIRGAGETEHVDFAIQINGGEHARPTVLVELKRIGIDLGRKHLKQASSYAINTGCEWIILTNGRQWRVYHVDFGQPPETKTLYEWDLLDDDLDQLAHRFELIGYNSLKNGVLDELWRKRKVLAPRNMLQAILGEASIKILRRELRKSTRVLLSPEDVIGGVRRLLNEGALTVMEEMAIRFPKRRAQRKKKVAPTEGSRKRHSVALAQLLEHDQLKPPLKLFFEYKGQRAEATLRADGTIEYQGQRYENPSKAAGAARSVILGRKSNANGWTFWQFQDAHGQQRSLANVREAFAKRQVDADAETDGDAEEGEAS